MKSNQWFKDQELSTVVCILPNGKKTEVDILTQTDAEHCFKMQERGYTFKKKVVVHKEVDQSKICTDSCEE